MGLRLFRIEGEFLEHEIYSWALGAKFLTGIVGPWGLDISIVAKSEGHSVCVLQPANSQKGAPSEASSLPFKRFWRYRSPSLMDNV